MLGIFRTNIFIPRVWKCMNIYRFPERLRQNQATPKEVKLKKKKSTSVLNIRTIVLKFQNNVMFLFYFMFTVQSFLNSVWLSVSTWKFVAELKSINIILFSYCFFSMYGVKIFCPNKLTQQKPSFCRSLFSYLDLGFLISVTAIHKGPTIWLLRKGGGEGEGEEEVWVICFG